MTQPIVEGAPQGTGSIKARALRGTVVSLLGQGGAQALRLASNLILSRLLFPEAFGLMAIVRMVQNGLTLASDVGIGASVIRHARGEERDFLDTAWTIQVLRGGLLWAVGAALALPLARFYDEPQLAWMILAATAGAFVAGFNSTKLILLNRRIHMERVVGIEIGGQLLALVTMVTIAWWTRSVWALVVGGLVATSARMLMTHLLIPGAGNRFRWESDAASEILSFGKWILVSTMITFVASRFDVVMLGKLLPMDQLGIYSIGLLIAGVPRVVLEKVTQSILLPAFSAANLESKDRLRDHYARARKVALPACLVALLAAVAASPAFFYLLYDPRYHDAGWVAQLALLGLWFTFLDQTAGRALAALGDSRALAVANTQRLAVTVLGCIGGFWLGGLPGVLIGMALGAFWGQLSLTLALRRHGIDGLRENLVSSAAGIGLGGLIALGPYAVETSLPLPMLTAVFGVAVLAPLAVRVATSVLRELRS